jgi:hypothetical protein
MAREVIKENAFEEMWKQAMKIAASQAILQRDKGDIDDDGLVEFHAFCMNKALESSEAHGRAREQKVDPEVRAKGNADKLREVVLEAYVAGEKAEQESNESTMAKAGPYAEKLKGCFCVKFNELDSQKFISATRTGENKILSNFHDRFVQAPRSDEDDKAAKADIFC